MKLRIPQTANHREPRGDDVVKLYRAEAQLVRLRWLGMASWVPILQFADFTLPAGYVYGVHAAAVAYTAAAHWLLHRGRGIRSLVVATTILDTVVVTLICLGTGGLQSPLYPFFYFSILGTAVRFGVSATFLLFLLNCGYSAALYAWAPGPSAEAGALWLRLFYLFFATLLASVLSRSAAESYALAARERDRSRDLAWRLIRAQEEERRRVAGDIHDRMGHRLFEVFYGIDRCRERLAASDPEGARMLAQLGGEARALSGEIRRLMDELHPSVLDDFGFPEALREYAAALREQHELDVALRVDPRARAGRRDVNVALFRILQEAVLNVRKHAEAARIEIELDARADGSLSLSVADDGTGFDPARVPRGHYGLLTMRQRAEACGGRLEVESSPGRGTRIRAVVPAD